MALGGRKHKPTVALSWVRKNLCASLAILRAAGGFEFGSPTGRSACEIGDSNALDGQGERLGGLRGQRPISAWAASVGAIGSTIRDRTPGRGAWAGLGLGVRAKISQGGGRFAAIRRASRPPSAPPFKPRPRPWRYPRRRGRCCAASGLPSGALASRASSATCAAGGVCDRPAASPGNRPARAG